MGGVAIWAAVLAGVAAAAAFDGARRFEPWLALLAGGSFLCLIGAIDDRRNLKPATKVVVQLIAAAARHRRGLPDPLLHHSARS